MRKVFYLAITVAFLLGGCKKEKKDLPGSISGTVIDKATNEPISAVGIQLNTGKIETTGDDGFYMFQKLNAEEYTLHFTKTGYKEETIKVNVKSGENTSCNMQLEKLPPDLRIVDDDRNDMNELNFGNDTDVLARSFNIYNKGYEPLEWEITYTAEWIIKVSKESGALNAGDIQSVVVTIDRKKLSSGNNTTTIHVISNYGTKQLTVKAAGHILPTLNVLPVSEITATTAMLNGEILTDGQPKYTKRGFVYSLSSPPALENTIKEITVPLTDNKTYSAQITELTLGQIYYVRAYATNSAGTEYSANETSFRTALPLPYVVLASANLMVSKTDASTNQINWTSAKNLCENAYIGDYDQWRLPSLNELGTLYSEKDNIGGFNTSANSSAYWSGTVSSGTSYYYLSFSDGSQGYAYSTSTLRARCVRSISTSPPALTTLEPTDITINSAVLGGNITYVGVPAYLEKGVCISTSPNPAINNKIIHSSASGTGTFSGKIINLIPNTTYYVRSYATTAAETAYGQQIIFKTLAPVNPSLTTLDATNITTTSATLGINITNIGNPGYTEKGVCYSTTSQNPNYNDKVRVITTGGNVTGNFTTTISNLTANTTYYVRAYTKQGSIQPAIISYGATKTFRTDPEMVFVQGGTFMMGQAGLAEPVHQVTLSNFNISKHEVTEGLWKAVMGSNPSVPKGDNYPVENVSWNDIAGTSGASIVINGITYRENGFIYKLNQFTGKNYRLPTEAEWEYAARGGNQSQGYKYSGSNTAGNVAWYDSNSGGSKHIVGTKQPNELGIYDMSGNVWEWCSDWWGNYSSSNQTNPVGPATGTRRVLRGGGWITDAEDCRVALHGSHLPDYHDGNVGFRLVLP